MISYLVSKDNKYFAYNTLHGAHWVDDENDSSVCRYSDIADAYRVICFEKWHNPDDKHLIVKLLDEESDEPPKRRDYVADVVLSVLTTQPTNVKEIRALTGLKDLEIRQAVKRLRLAGHKICSGKPGFWIWDGVDDSYSHTIKRILAHAYSEIEIARAMQGLPLEGQMEVANGLVR